MLFMYTNLKVETLAGAFITPMLYPTGTAAPNVVAILTIISCLPHSTR